MAEPRVLIDGNRAMAEAAVRAGAEAYFGYPITPQTEILEHFAQRMAEEGRAFLQAESELAAINMVYGAASVGARAITSSSSPGISLKQEGLSYIAASEVPAVVLNVMRGGPGLGNVQPAQSDYFQTVKMAGHGDFRMIVLAPASVQEAIDHVVLAFDLADKYRTVVTVVADGSIGQMMEPVVLPPMKPVRDKSTPPDWALTGAKGRAPRSITSLYLGAENLERHNLKLQEKLATIQATEGRIAEMEVDDADLIIIAFGTVGRIAQTVVRDAREQGMRVGLLRPVTLWPFPDQRIAELSTRVAGMLVVEMNAGQMVEDVERAVAGRCPVRFLGKMGGVIPLPDDILPELAMRGGE